MSEIEAGKWFDFPRGKLDYSSTKGEEAMVLDDIALLFAFQELRRLGYEAYVGNMTINREHYQKRHQSGYKRKFGDLWEVLMDLDKGARAAGLQDFHPHYVARGKDEDVVVKVTANGHAAPGDMDPYLEMARARGLVPAHMAVSVRRRGTKFLVETYDLCRL